MRMLYNRKIVRWGFYIPLFIINGRQVWVYKLIFLEYKKTWAIFKTADVFFFLAKNNFFIYKKINIG